MESLIKIGPFVWAVEMTQTDTDAQTHRHTDTLASIATYSVKFTGYNNIVILRVSASDLIASCSVKMTEYSESMK